MNSDPVLLYLHLPKAGGTTLNAWLYNQLQDGSGQKDESGKFQAGIYYYPAGYVREPDPAVRRRAKDVLKRENLKAVLGHFQFGIHQYLNRPWVYVTVLRDPIDRVSSLYHFQTLVQERKGSLDGVRMPEKMSLQEFVRGPLYSEVNNGQTRRIAGVGPGGGRCTQRTLDRAKENLDQHFEVVGLTECFDETVALIRHKFGWPAGISHFPKNINPFKPSVSALSRESVDAVAERNELDCELYEYAKQRFNANIAAQGSDFTAELEATKSNRRKGGHQP